MVPPFTGHVNPAKGLAAELVRRGHEVAWVGPEGAPELAPRPPELRAFAAMKYLWEEVLVPLAEAMVPAVEKALAQFCPDVLVVDQQAFAGALVAERAGLPWATLATTSAEFTDPLAALPNVAQWLSDLFSLLRKQFGDPSAVHDLRFSPRLVIGCTTEELAGPARGPVCFVGPIERPSEEDFPLAAGPPLVFVSLGTANVDVGARFLGECVAALGDRSWLRALVLDPGGVLGPAPANVTVLPRAPQLAVLDHASLVLCHAGHNTVCEALSRGVPLVVAPIRDDQPIVADQVVSAGAGLRLRFTRAGASHIGLAVDTVLGEPSYAEAAQRVAASFRAGGGARTAADRLERL
ncbi:glycosyltransferase [Kutzneria viridogrisea]